MICYIGIGSNLGDRIGNLRRSIDLLKELPDIKIRKVSGIYENEPWGPEKDQPDFLNMALEVDCGKEPRGLLKDLKDIETSLGRKDGPKWGPRAIDLDILYFGNLIIRETGLVIPHDRVTERFFVLKPMVDLDPDWEDPVSGKTIRRMLEELDWKGRWRKLDETFV